MIEKSQGLPEVWDEEVDLVVLGSGSAALTGAVVAAVEGASVIVLEKAALVGGTTSLSGGGFWIPVNRHMSERGVDDSREEALEYMRACAGDQGDDSHIVALVDHGAPMVEFLEDRAGCTFRPWPAQRGTIDYRPWLPGSRPGARTLDAGRFTVAELGEWGTKVRTGGSSKWVHDRHIYYAEGWHSLPIESIPGVARSFVDADTEYYGAGTALISQLLKSALAHGVTVLTETPGKEILVDDGRVVGVRAERDGRPYYVRALLGVHVGTGGFAQSEELKRLWLQRPLENSCEAESCTGDGHLMGMAVGAAVAGLGDAWWMPQGAGREDRKLPHSLIVNMSAKRFINEAMNYYDFGAEAFGTKEGGSARNNPCWMIIDSQGVRKYSQYAFKIGKTHETGDFADLPDGVVGANTLAELAGVIGLDAEVLKATVDRFNEFARKGEDPDFGRGQNPFDVAWGDHSQSPNPALGPVEEGPFYGVHIYPGALSTRGGLRVNANGQVLSALPPFEPIPGLYAAGNCSDGSVAGAYTGAGATIGAAMTFGYIIGKRVASRVDAPLTTA